MAVAAALVAVSLVTIVRPSALPFDDATASLEDGSQAWPAGLRQAAESAFAADAYRMVPSPGGVWETTNPAQGLKARFSPTGIEVRPGAGEASWVWSMSPIGLGRGDALARVSSAEVAVAEGAEYRRGSLTEWYRNGEDGIEQGFTLTAPPLGDAGPLVLELSSSGLTPRLVDDGAAVALDGPQRNEVLRYDALHVYDANGSEVSARLDVRRGRIAIVVDDGAAPYPLTIDPIIWSQQKHLLATDGSQLDLFGGAVAVDGDTAVVGSIRANPSSAYVFVRNGTGWAQQQRITVPDAFHDDYFGSSVAVSGDTLLVGAPGNDIVPSHPGSAFVYVRHVGNFWVQEQQLTGADVDAGSLFGTSVALSGNTAVVGAPRDGPEYRSSFGSAFVFTRSGTTWEQEQRLEGSAPSHGDWFGRSVALSGDTVVVGASFDDTDGGDDAGSAYVFTRSDGTWSQQQHFLTAASSDHFGYSVALSGDTAVVGAPYDDTLAGEDTGSAHVFVRNGTTWSKQKTIYPPNVPTVALGDLFGFSVALSGDTAVVGAPKNNGLSLGLSDMGGAYVYSRIGNVWSRQAFLAGSSLDAGDEFGRAVAVAGNTAVIGAPFDDQLGDAAGSAYVHVRAPFGWLSLQQLIDVLGLGERR